MCCSNYSACIKGRIVNLLAAEGGNDESLFWRKKEEVYLFEFILFLFLLVATIVIRFALMISNWGGKKIPLVREKCIREELKAKADKMVMEGSAEEQKRQERSGRRMEKRRGG